MLQSILVGLGGTIASQPDQHLRMAVSASFSDLKKSKGGAVVIVDDAHLLTDEQFDELQHFGTASPGEVPLARLLLVGRSTLEQRLTDPPLAALNQHVICHLCLEPLTEQQSIDYVKFRIEWAGGKSSQIFTPRALERIALICNGLPACLNSLCDHVLLLAFVQEQNWVTEEIVDDALIDVQHLPLPWNLPAAGQDGHDLSWALATRCQRSKALPASDDALTPRACPDTSPTRKRGASHDGPSLVNWRNKQCPETCSLACASG